MNCTVCDSNNTELYFKKNGYRILHCTDCDQLFADITVSYEKVKIIYSNEYFWGEGDGYPDYTLEKNILIKRGENYADIIKNFIPTGRILDVGSAAGFILKGFENRGWQGTGIEPNQSMVEYGRNVVGVNILNSTLENAKLNEQFDLVIMIQVIAHLYNLKDSFKKIKNNLKPGGFLLIETWNKDSRTARFLGKNWHEIFPPSSINYFSKKTLNRLLNLNGFSLIAGGRPKKSIHSIHAKSILRHRLLEIPKSKWLAKFLCLIPNDIIIPYPAEDLFWALFKKT